MDNTTRQALESIRLDWATTPDDVWGPQAPLHVTGLHEPIVGEVMRAFGDAVRSSAGSPLGVAIRGPAGSGKTHLLGQVREQVHAAGGYFFLIKLLDGENFWRSVLICMLEDLSRPTPTHRSQLTQLLYRLGTEAGVPSETLASVTGESDLTPEHLDSFVRGVYTTHSRHRRRSQHILRALVLTESDDFAVKDLGECFLHLDIEDADDLSVWGIRNARLGYQEIVENISRIIAFDNAAVLAVDQLDSLIEAAKSERREDENSVEKVAHGLMTIRETMSRTAAVVSCITAAWEYLEGHVMRSVVDRFRQPPILQRPATADFGQTLLAKRFSPCFDEVGFVPPYPTWPVTVEALSESRDYTPRELMRSVDRFIGTSLRSDVFTEMRHLDGRTPPISTTTDTGKPGIARLDERFEELVASANPEPALGQEQEDVTVPPLLHAGLATWIEALPDDAQHFEQDAEPGPKANLHGVLRRIVDFDTDAQETWSFRAISASHYKSVQARLTKATTAAGLSLGGKRRTLIVLRRTPWPSGAKTTQMVEEMHARGGHVVAWSDDDIRTLMALRQLRSERSEFLSEWIALRNPAGQIAFLRDIVATSLVTEPMSGSGAGEDGRHAAPEPSLLPPLATPPPSVPKPTPSPARRPAPQRQASVHAGIPSTAPADPREAATVTSPSPVAIADRTPVASSHTAAVAVPSITLGIPVTGGPEVSVSLEALRKHTAIFAGSGSGKTVLIRRMIEECALQGVSSIVLDVNNDLARLGMPWPDGERTWSSELEEEKAKQYFADTEIAVFTPGRSSGRPLSFRPLPDLTDVVDDPDEFEAAVEAAAAGLIPRALVGGRTAKASQSQAVLKDALRYFGRQGHGGIAELIELLTDLPDGVSGLREARRYAADMAENLKAARANDPLFGGAGAPADPGVLLTPSPGYRARVSVINLAALSSEDKRSNFVNELQMALFAWIKKHPAGDRPLGGLFVMDEAQNYAPSDRGTACSQSTLALVSQARKYGLGLVLATQAPKGLNAKIPGNSATQFFGMLNAPVQIDTAREIARAKGSSIDDVGRLRTGVFYVAREGGGFAKISTPLCLSHHPKSPPTEEEVVDIARESAG